MKLNNQSHRPARGSHMLPTMLGLVAASALLLPDATGQSGRKSGNGTTMGEVAGGPEAVSSAGPLSSLPIPLPADLQADYIRDFQAAVSLGKAFFWDIQAGSDGATACATCHWQAGADSRTMSQLHPGFDGTFDQLGSGGGGVNYTVKGTDFPFTQRTNPNDHDSDVARDSNDRLTSSGVPARTFTGVTPGVAEEQGVKQTGHPFAMHGINVGQTAGRNAQSVINSIYHVRTFWDGRADSVFNGVNHLGARDQSAKVLKLQGDGTLAWVSVAIQPASLASQAVGPALSSVEMSYDGKAFKELGRKMLSMRPLKDQVVDTTDLHLGALSDYPNRGLQPSVKYSDMIKAAFHEQWWNGQGRTSGFTQMEHNFSLYWGLAIMCYESTLVSDQTPWDRYAAGDESALTDEQKEGLNIYMSGGAACNACHMAPEFAGVTWSQYNADGWIERMATADSLAEGEAVLTTFPDPALNILGVDPRGKLLEILTPQGELVARGMVPGIAGDCTLSEVEVELAAGPVAPMPPAGSGLEPLFAATLEVAVHEEPLPSGLCNVSLEVGMQWGPDPALPAGNYEVRLDGVAVATLTMGTPQSIGIYDRGFYNLGARPTFEDIGNGALSSVGPLSIVERLKQGDPTVAHLMPNPPIGANERSQIAGTFKTPGLRNIALTGPYFHHGGASTLEQVIQFYARGADFAEVNAADLDADVEGVGTLRNSPEKQKALATFLREALTDPRVVNRSGPFCHPSLPLKDGYLGNETMVVDDGHGEAIERITEIPATGAAGTSASMPEFQDRIDGGVEVLVHCGNTIYEKGHEGCGQFALPFDSNRHVLVSLSTRPTANVTIDLSSSAPSQMSVEPQQLVFTTDDWFHPQEIRVNGVQDGQHDGNSVVTVITSHTSSSDPRYAGLPVEDLHYNVQDSTHMVKVVYVDQTTPNPTFENGSYHNPYDTIAEALACADDGALIEVGWGTYRENLVIQGKKVLLRSYAGATIDGGGNGPCVTVFGRGTRGTQLIGFRIVNGGNQNAEAGGVLITDSSDVLIDACYIGGNTAMNGAGVHVRNSSKVTFRDATLDGNSATQDGGGLYVNGGMANLALSWVRNNTAGNKGGGVHSMNSAKLLVDNSALDHNLAGQFGGGLFLNGGTADFRNVRVMENTAGQQGGGVHAENSVVMKLRGVKVTNNTVTQASGAGGMWLDGGMLDFGSVTIADNSGLEVFFMNSNAAWIHNSIIWGGGQGAAMGTNVSHALPGVVEYSIVDWNGFAATGFLTSDPMFLDGAGGQHGLRAGSPGLDSGDPSEQDPDGSRIDMGAHPVVGS
jgi:cytochrome c peroxidase